MELVIDDKNAVELNEYKGKYSINALSYHDGKLYKVWCKQLYGKDKMADKATPVKVQLGDKSMAIKALQMMIDEIQGGGDIPF